MPPTAGGRIRLLLFAFEKDNCLDCHDGKVASTDIAFEVTKPYRHGVQDYTGVHDAAEDFTFGRVDKHVECSDCHNPHQDNGDPSPGGGVVSGAITGVSGVNAAGQAVIEARYLYEICFKCHGNSDYLGPSGLHGSDYQHLLTGRLVTDDNTPKSPSSYALCYKCHIRSVLLNNTSFEHRKHVVDQNTPCSACHTPHGISAMHGNSLKIAI